MEAQGKKMYLSFAQNRGALTDRWRLDLHEVIGTPHLVLRVVPFMPKRLFAEGKADRQTAQDIVLSRVMSLQKVFAVVVLWRG